MKFLLLLTCCTVLGLGKADAQLAFHNVNQNAMAGFSLTLTDLDCPKMVYPDGRHVGSYVGVNVDISYYNFDQWGLRYNLDMKWMTDLTLKAAELFRGDGLDARIDFSGLLWNKVGLNVFATDRFCIGVGASAADYIIDLPDWNADGNFPNELPWQEPSGWYWAAGPALFLDAGVGDFAVSMTTSLDIPYWHPKVTDDYEANISVIEDYPAPRFFCFDLTVNHESGMFFSYDRTTMTDKGVHGLKMTRGDFQLGYRASI